MPSTPGDIQGRTYWTPTQNEQIVQWLEEPRNQSRLMAGSGLTKKDALAPLARQFPSKSPQQMFDKYINIRRAHSKAAQLNAQPGWGLKEEDLDEGTMNQRGKLFSICPFFFRLDAIWGGGPNEIPRGSMESGCGAAGSGGSPIPFEVLQAVLNNNLSRNLQSACESSEGGGDSVSGLGCYANTAPRLAVPMETQAGSASRPMNSLAVSTASGSDSLGKRPALRPGVREVFPPVILISDSEDETPCRKKMKGTDLTLGDTLTKLSTARAKSDQVKYDLIKKQIAQQDQRLVQQREQEKRRLGHQMDLDTKRLAQEDRRMDLDRRLIELEEKKVEAEILKYKAIIAQAGARGGATGAFQGGSAS